MLQKHGRHKARSGVSTLSRADTEITHQIVDAAKDSRATVHDRVIIGRSGHASVKAKGLL